MKTFFRQAAIAAALAVAAAFSGLSAASAADPGATAVSMLKYDIGARPLALGGAFAAMQGGIYGMRYNPAGLALSGGAPEASLMLQQGIMDTKMQFIGGALPLPFAGFSGQGHASAGASLLYSSNGDMGWYQTDPLTGGVLHNGDNISAGSDMVLSFGYAEKFSSEPLRFNPRSASLGTLESYMGAAVKIISSKLPDLDGSMSGASALAVDLGYLAEVPEWNARGGFSLLNLGGGVKYKEVSSPLPFALRAGGAYTYAGFMRGVTGSLDVIRYMTEQLTRVRVGMELPVDRYAALRFGYRFLEDSGGFTMGIGAHFANISCNFGMAFNGDLGNTTQFDFNYRFGGQDAKTAPDRAGSLSSGIDLTLPRPGEKKNRAGSSGGELFLEMNEIGAPPPPAAKPKPAPAKPVTAPNGVEEKLHMDDIRGKWKATAKEQSSIKTPDSAAAVSAPAPLPAPAGETNISSGDSGEEDDARSNAAQKWEKIITSGDDGFAYGADDPSRKMWKKVLKEQREMGEPETQSGEEDPYADLSKDEIARAKWQKIIDSRAAETKAAVRVSYPIGKAGARAKRRAEKPDVVLIKSDTKKRAASAIDSGKAAGAPAKPKTDAGIPSAAVKPAADAPKPAAKKIKVSYEDLGESVIIN